MILKLAFPRKKIEDFASKYQYQDDAEVEQIGLRAQVKGYYSKKDFITITSWKTPRSKPLCKSNGEDLIKEVTGIALQTKNEYLKIKVLQILKGVSYPTASVLLHFATAYDYPILDFRTLWSLGIEGSTKYNFELWKSYTNYCRKVCLEENLNMRILDRALWQYSKENQ